MLSKSVQMSRNPVIFFPNFLCTWSTFLEQPSKVIKVSLQDYPFIHKVNSFQEHVTPPVLLIKNTHANNHWIHFLKHYHLPKQTLVHSNGWCTFFFHFKGAMSQLYFTGKSLYIPFSSSMSLNWDNFKLTLMKIM